MIDVKNYELRARKEASERLISEHNTVMVYAVYTTLLSIAMMNLCVSDMSEVMTSSHMYRKSIKHSYLRFMSEYKKYKDYINKGYEYFLKNDIISDKAEEFHIDILKMRLSVENYLNKFDVSYSYEMSYILMVVMMIDEVISVDRCHMEHIKEIEPNFRINDKILPKSLKRPINELILSITSLYRSGKTINLNDDFSTKIGMDVIDTKIMHESTLMDLINKIEL